MRYTGERRARSRRENSGGVAELARQPGERAVAAHETHDGARRSALGARRSALGARRSALGARRFILQRTSAIYSTSFNLGFYKGFRSQWQAGRPKRAADRQPLPTSAPPGACPASIGRYGIAHGKISPNPHPRLPADGAPRDAAPTARPPARERGPVAFIPASEEITEISPPVLRGHLTRPGQACLCPRPRRLPAPGILHPASAVRRAARRLLVRSRRGVVLSRRRGGGCERPATLARLIPAPLPPAAQFDPDRGQLDRPFLLGGGQIENFRRRQAGAAAQGPLDEAGHRAPGSALAPARPAFWRRRPGLPSTPCPGGRLRPSSRTEDLQQFLPRVGPPAGVGLRLDLRDQRREFFRCPRCIIGHGSVPVAG